MVLVVIIYHHQQEAQVVEMEVLAVVEIMLQMAQLDQVIHLL